MTGDASKTDEEVGLQSLLTEWTWSDVVHDCLWVCVVGRDTGDRTRHCVSELGRAECPPASMEGVLYRLGRV